MIVANGPTADKLSKMTLYHDHLNETHLRLGKYFFIYAPEKRENSTLCKKKPTKKYTFLQKPLEVLKDDI